jgi:hypothetical protein
MGIETTSCLVQICAKNRLIVTACLAGNDYATNIRGKSFGVVRNIVIVMNNAEKADILLKQVQFLELL